MQVAVVLCPYLLTTEGSFDSPTVVPQVPWLYARAYSVRMVSSAFRQASRVSKKRFVSTGWEPKTKTKSIHFIASSSAKAAEGVGFGRAAHFCCGSGARATVHALARCYH